MKDTTKHTTLKDSHYLTVTPDERKDTHQLSIGYNIGTGDEYRKTDRAQVDIWICGKPVFTGTFEDLQSTIKAGHQMEQEGIIINGYKIKYNGFWSLYQANHIESIEIGQANFDSLQDAINYAANG